MEVGPRFAHDSYMAPFVEHERRRRRDDAEMLGRLGKLDGDWPDDPAVPDLACELAVVLRISAHEANERLRIARALQELPEIARAHRDGRLSRDQLRWVTRFATSETDRAWAERAPGMRPFSLRLEFLRQRRISRRAARRDHEARELHTAWDEEKRFFEMNGRWAAEQGVAVESALQQAAERIQSDPDADDPPAARRADALESLVTSSGATPAPATIVVHADAEALSGATEGRHLAETSAGVQVGADTVRRIACDAKVLVALERRGRPVALRSGGRLVSQHQMNLLRHRDLACTFPGCGSTWFLHAHHIEHWADGGETSLENLTLICGPHHRRLHDGKWTIRGRPPDGLEFVSGSGRVFSEGGALARAG